MGSLVTLILGGIAFIVIVSVTVKYGIKYQRQKQAVKKAEKLNPSTAKTRKSDEGSIF